MSRKRSTLLAIVATATLIAATMPASGDIDHARAVNILPPGNVGTLTMAEFTAYTATGALPPHFDDQRELYASFGYKAMPLGKGGRKPLDLPGTDAKLFRDAYGVPRIVASNRDELMRGFGAVTAIDRLFEMELFRRAGHGRLAEILGEGFVDADIEARRLLQGPAARAAELATASERTRRDLDAYTDGVNAWIGHLASAPDQIPAEFVLLGALPIEPWTVDDSLAFGEYAGRFFGEWGHAEIEMAAQLAVLIERDGVAQGQAKFDDLYPLDDPAAPVTIDPADGTFPRHTAPAVQAAGPVNARPDRIAPSSHLVSLARAMTAAQTRTAGLRRAVGLKGFGSNQYIVSGTHTRSGHALIVSEPQTGWAVPSFFYEVELHAPDYHVRGVTVPGLNFIPIGRNRDIAWAVTSSLDANSDTFVETTDATGRLYLHDDEFKPFQNRIETIRCSTPPTVLLELPEPTSACLAPSRQVELHRSVHGPVLAMRPPFAFSRQSVVDGNIISSLEAWTQMSLSSDVASFGDAASGVAFGFNFMVADSAGDIGYFHSGRYPIRPADVDPRLPIPGTGEWDWQGFEAWEDQPHVINPSSGFAANWNNKPARGWHSKGLLGATFPEGRPVISTWSADHQVVGIQNLLTALGTDARFEDMARIEQDASALDNRARAWRDRLLAAIDAVGGPRLRPARAALADWDLRRTDTDGDGFYDAPGLALFDRWVERVLPKAFLRELPLQIWEVASGIGSNGTYTSADNGDTPTFKFENAIYGTFDNLLAGATAHTWEAGADLDALMVAALREAVEDLNHMGRGGYRKPVETVEFSPLGAAAVPSFGPLPNRGSYGQIVEPR